MKAVQGNGRWEGLGKVEWCGLAQESLRVDERRQSQERALRRRDKERHFVACQLGMGKAGDRRYVLGCRGAGQGGWRRSVDKAGFLLR